MKSFAKWTAALAVCLMFLAPVCADAESVADTQAPVLSAISADRSSVQAGESIYFTLDVSDDMAGVINAAVELTPMEEYREVNGRHFEGETLLVPFGRDGYTSKRVVVEVPTDEICRNGRYAVTQVILLDAAMHESNWAVGHATSFWNDHLLDIGSDEYGSKKLLTVDIHSQYDTDDTPPVFVSMEADRDTVTAGDYLNLKVDVEETGFGFYYWDAEFEQINVPEDQKDTFYMQGYHENNWNYSQVDSDQTPGQYRLTALKLFDQNENCMVYGEDKNNPIPVDLVITVTNDSEKKDTTPPVMESLTLEKNKAFAGETIQFTVKCNEPIARTWLRFEGDIYGVMEVVPEEDYAVCEISVNRFVPNGTYKLEYAVVTDQAGNEQEYLREINAWDQDALPLPQDIEITVENIGLYNQTPNSYWAEDAGGWKLWVTDDNGYYIDGWHADTQGMCYLNDDGYPMTNSWVLDPGGWSYVDGSGHMVTYAWLEDSQGWCYVGNNGYAVTDTWMQDSMGWCYLDGSGRMAKSCWVLDYQGWCYLDENGYMVTNRWVQDSQGWCYLDGTGHALTNAWMADSQGWCYLDGSGRMAKSCWVMDSQGWCYLNDSGYVVTDCWAQDSQGWCYLDDSGRMATNRWMQDSHGWCYLGEDGRMVKNQYVDDSTGPQWIGEDGYVA